MFNSSDELRNLNLPFFKWRSWEQFMSTNAYSTLSNYFILVRASFIVQFGGCNWSRYNQPQPLRFSECIVSPSLRSFHYIRFVLFGTRWILNFHGDHTVQGHLTFLPLIYLVSPNTLSYLPIRKLFHIVLLWFLHLL